MSKTILIADDEERMRRLIADFLTRESYTVVEAATGTAALDKFQQGNIDLVILDIMMPGFDGWTVCKEIRKQSNIPVIMLTARSEETEQLLGFELGADEYITKPFSPRILTARVNAFFRRHEQSKNISLGGLKVDDSARIAYLDGQVLELSPKEYDLLVLFAENPGKALSREQILNHVWSYDYFGGLRTVDTHVNRLRIKLGDSSSLIQTIRGFGYRFEVNHEDVN